MKEYTKQVLRNLLNRFSQESTWRGLIAVLTAFGVTMDPTQANAIMATGLFMIGTINLAKND